MTKDNFESALEVFQNGILTPDNILQAFNSLMPFISLWNPGLAVVLSSFNPAMKIGVNILSRRKAERRIVQIVKTIGKIYRMQLSGETNYEAALICPELFRNVLMFKDEERVKEHLALIEVLFSTGEFGFDGLAEALRLVNQLSSIEYKILKLIPPNKTKWKKILKEKEVAYLFKNQRQQLTAAFLSLINMNLVVRKLAIKANGGPELGTINFGDDIEYIHLSAYGQLFLKTMEEIRIRHEN